MIKNTLLFILAVYLMFFIGDSKANMLTVYYKESLPYLSVEHGIPDGKASTILRKYAIDTGTKFEYKPVNTISELIDNVSNTENSVGIGAISINHTRLLKVDFTLPYNITDTVLAYEAKITFKSALYKFVTILYAFKPFFISMLIVSVLLRIAQMSFFNALYLSVVTATTVGFGDIIPKGFQQKLIIIVWMLISTYFLSLFTSVLTVSLNNDTFHKPITVGVINDSEGHRVCQVKQYNCKTYDTIIDMIKALRGDQISSIIHDKDIILQYGLSYKVISNSMHSIIMNKDNNIKLNKYIKF